MNSSKPIDFLAGEGHELYKIAWEYSPQAFILIDSAGAVIHLNETVFRMFGIGRDTPLESLNLLSFFTEEYKNKAKSDFTYALANGELKDCEYYVSRANGSVFPISVAYRKANLGNNENYILLQINDITKPKIDERAIRQAKERAEVADKLKTSFLANMSHEIRTPINAVIGFADLLNDPDLLQEEKEEYIKTIQVNGELLLKLINDIIDIAKIESGQLKILKNEFSVENFMDEIYISTRNLLHAYDKPHLIIDKNIDSRLIGKSIITDQYRLMQIINNLLSNAIKFTDSGRIDFGVQLLENGRPEFYVSDTGIGMNETELDYIFDRFGQVESALERNQGGTGLGLSITKSLVELLGGRIKVSSQSHKGSIFTFTIDASSVDGKMMNGNRKKVNFSGKRILIVEDTESNYRLLNILLEKHGAETIWALNGNQGVAICKNSRDIDMVLMDINLPDIDGYEATSQIKKFRPNLPIIAQTAYAMAGEKERSLEFGCDDYISKPIIPDKLFSTISAYLY